MGNDDVLRRLSFGVKKTTKNNDFKKHRSGDDTSSLRLRVLPENIKADLRQLKKQAKGEDEISQVSSDNSEKDVLLFSDKPLPAGDSYSQSEKSPLNGTVSDVVQKKIAIKIAHLRRINRMYTWGENIPDPFIDFDELDVPEQLSASLKEFGIREPTPIQMQAIPLMFQRRDLLCSAPTGSGKTLAFALPIILEILRLKKLKKYKEGGKLLTIVLEPTRELAAQTYRQFLKFAAGLNVVVGFFEDNLPQNVDILISTPNRIVHHVEDMELKYVRWLVVDESDRLFEVIEGQERCFRSQLATIYKACDGKFTRRAFFSATFSYEVEEWCKENLSNVAMLCIGERNSSNANVTQELIFAGSEHGKVVALRDLLSNQFEPPALIFVQSKERGRELLAAISRFTPPISVQFISSEKSRAEREKIIESFRAGRILVLICTELMGRGLDLKNVNLVINFDIPTSIVSYIHRVGRTGRAGRSGRSVTYFTEDDTKFLRPIATVISQAGFSVPDYALSLKPVNRSEKNKLLRHAPKRKHIAFLKKGPKGARKVNKLENVDKDGKIQKRKSKKSKLSGTRKSQKATKIVNG